MNTTLAFDPGYGNIKLFGNAGGVVMQSMVAYGDLRRSRRMAGLKAAQRSMRIETSSGTFFVGPNAHDWGRPVENLDMERLSGTPEFMALFYGAVSMYPSMLPESGIDLLVGLPIGILTDPDLEPVQQALRQALRRSHTWLVEGTERRIEISGVRMTYQPVGAMFDYLLDCEGRMLSMHEGAFRGEIGIIGIGMNTLELLVVRNGAPVQRFTAGDSLGVRRALELADPAGTRSLAERDALARSGKLSMNAALAIWQSEVLGYIEHHWSNAYRRFGAVIAAGGGSVILRDTLLRRFREKLYLPDDPILSTARGLHKYALMVSARSHHG